MLKYIAFLEESKKEDFEFEQYCHRPEYPQREITDCYPLDSHDVRVLLKNHLFESDDGEIPQIFPHPTNKNRSILIGNNSTNPNGVKGLIIPHHAERSMNELSARRNAIYPPQRGENGEVLGDINPVPAKRFASIFKRHLESHFTPNRGENREQHLERQKSEERAAFERLSASGLIGLGESGHSVFGEGIKTDSVSFHPHPKTGRKYVPLPIKGVSAYSPYVDEAGGKHILNTCAGQSEGCGGKIVDGIAQKNGGCFAKNAEFIRKHAFARRLGTTMAVHSPHPGIQRDYALAFVHCLRQEQQSAQKKGRAVCIRPDTLDQTDYGKAAHALVHLNQQGRAIHGDNYIPIEGYMYNKIGVSDPNLTCVHSNTGPKVKNGEFTGNQGFVDRLRRESTVEGSKENSNSYVVGGGRGVTKGSPLADEFAKVAKVARYWDAGTPVERLSDEERNQPKEAHYDGEGNPTTEENSHFGHITKNGVRYGYQKQHVLHQAENKVQVVGKNGKSEEVESDSRHLDNARADAMGLVPFRNKHGAKVGHLIFSTPTGSTSYEDMRGPFFHHVDSDKVDEVRHNKIWDIDHPEEQEHARRVEQEKKAAEEAERASKKIPMTPA